MSKSSMILIIAAGLVALLALAVYGWAALPQQDAAAAAETALIPYWQEQKRIETAEMLALSDMRLERARAAQPFKTAALVVVWLALAVLAAAGSGLAVNVFYRRGQRLTREMALPVLRPVSESFVAVGHGEDVLLLNTVTGKAHAAMTAVPADATYAEIMNRVMLARTLTDGVTAVARHTGDPSSIDFLLGQVERLDEEAQG